MPDGGSGSESLPEFVSGSYCRLWVYEMSAMYQTFALTNSDERSVGLEKISETSNLVVAKKGQITFLFLTMRKMGARIGGPRLSSFCRRNTVPIRVAATAQQPTVLLH